MNIFVFRNLFVILILNVLICFLLLLTSQVAHANTIYWEDNFHRANGAVGNGWTSIDGQAGQIVNNQLNVNGGGYAVLYNPTTTTLPANYYVTITFPNSTMNNNLWWGLMGNSTSQLKIAYFNSTTKKWTILTSAYVVNTTNKTIATTVMKYADFVVIYPETWNLHNKFVNMLLG